MSTPAGIRQTSRAELARVVRGRRFVRPTDAAGELGIDDRTAARKLARWAEAGWMRRVRRGLYIPVPVDVEHPAMWTEDAMVVGSVVWDPCYFTGWTSANHWGLTEQSFRTIVLKTQSRVRRSSLDLGGREYLVTHVSVSDMEWGLTSVWSDDVRLRLADPARTVLDCFDSPRLGGGIRHSGDILRAFLSEGDAEKLIDYGDRLGNGAVFKRLGYVLDHLGLDAAALRAACLDRLSSGVALLDPQAPVRGDRDSKWRLRVNALVTADDPS